MQLAKGTTALKQADEHVNSLLQVCHVLPLDKQPHHVARRELEKACGRREVKEFLQPRVHGKHQLVVGLGHQRVDRVLGRVDSHNRVLGLGGSHGEFRSSSNTLFRARETLEAVVVAVVAVVALGDEHGGQRSPLSSLRKTHKKVAKTEQGWLRWR